MDSFFLLVFYSVTILTLLLAGTFYFFMLRHRRFRDISQALDLALFKILLPQDLPHFQEGDKRDPKETFFAMEQLYSGLLLLKKGGFFTFFSGRPVIAFEIALPSVGEDAVLYAAVPNYFSSIFEKQIHSLFPSSVVERSEDYNIFNAAGASKGLRLALEKHALLPIKTYERLGRDPFSVIAGAFSKLKTESDGAAVQILLRPSAKPLNATGKEVVKEIRKGKKLSEALSSRKGFWSGMAEAAGVFALGSSKSAKELQKPQQPPDEELARLVESKAAKPGFDVNIRIFASAENEADAERILRELEGTFVQFTEAQGNSFKSTELKGKELDRGVYQFSFRLFNASSKFYLNTEELASIFHFPYGGLPESKLLFLKSREAPAPSGLPKEGLLLGKNVFRGDETPIYITKDDRRRHLYIIGQTGTGKTFFMKNMIRQDIEKGEGVCFIDPHGDTIKEILGYIPKERIEDVIYFDPSDVERPIGINFLEYDTRFPEQKTFLVNELFSIFQKLYGDVPEALGPMFQQYFRNATLLVMEDPPSGNTLLEIERVLVDQEFRDLKLSRTSNIVVTTFWKQIAEKAGGEASLQNIVPYITSKFDTFLANEIMWPIVAQEKSSFNIRDAMDEGKILLINLSKGRLGELNSALLGLILVGRILMASFSRVEMEEAKRRDFYLYIDEFQNVTTDSISTILSEARKYRLSLTIANQYIGQLEEKIKKAVFGNVGTMVTFRIGSDDGEFMEKQFQPVFTAQDLLNIDNRNAYIKFLIEGKTTRPFNIRSYDVPEGNKTVAAAVRDLSRLKYGRPREEVEKEIRRRQEKFS